MKKIGRLEGSPAASRPRSDPLLKLKNSITVDEWRRIAEHVLLSGKEDMPSTRAMFFLQLAGLLLSEDVRSIRENQLYIEELPGICKCCRGGGMCVIVILLLICSV